MIRIRLKEMIAEKEFREGRRILVQEVSVGANINRTTLSKIQHQRGFNTSLETINALCRYFECKVEDILEYVPDSEIENLPE